MRTILVPPSARCTLASRIVAASAPLVFIGETHAYPAPDFAEVMLRTHEKDWDVVVPGFSNANPEGASSWGSFILDYGAWWDELPAREIHHAPIYNTVSKRSALLAFGERLEEAFSHGMFTDGSTRAGAPTISSRRTEAQTNASLFGCSERDASAV